MFLLEVGKKSENPKIRKKYPKPVLGKPYFFETGSVFLKTGYPTGYIFLSRPDFLPDQKPVTIRSDPIRFKKNRFFTKLWTHLIIYIYIYIYVLYMFNP